MPKINASTEATPLDRFLTYRMHVIARISDRESSAGYLRECGLSLSEGRCLAAIGSFQPLSLQDLARAANQDLAQASRSATSLVAHGLVSKEASAEDGRGVVLSLTSAGRPVYRRAMKLIAARNEAIFSVLDADEQALLASMLDRVTAAVQAPDSANVRDPNAPRRRTSSKAIVVARTARRA